MWTQLLSAWNYLLRLLGLRTPTLDTPTDEEVKAYLQGELEDPDIGTFRENAWDFTRGFPFPRFSMRCPYCHAGNTDDAGFQTRLWKFHKGGSAASRFPDRVDVSIKCRACSHVWVHGLRCPPSLYDWAALHDMKPNTASIVFKAPYVIEILLNEGGLPQDVLDNIQSELPLLYT